MKKVIYIINSVLLISNILLFVLFVIYTLAGFRPFGSYTTDKDIEFQLLVTLIFEFLFFTLSKLFSLILKIDLSFKGTEILNLVPRTVMFLVVILALFLIVYSIIIRINIEFIVTIVVMVFSILLEFGITKMFKNVTT